MTPPLTVGSAVARPGEIVTGWFDAISLPTGGADRFPVIVAQGRADGPTAWITTGIHGDEHTGLLSIHHLITPDLVYRLRGTLVAVLSLSPAGLRIRKRIPYYTTDDPNRLFPEPGSDGFGEALGLEGAYRRLFAKIVATRPAFLLDLHNAWIGSIPFIFRDPVFYGRLGGVSRSRREAEALQARVGDLVAAFGFTVINEFVASSYVDRNLHRSVSGAVLNGGGIPAVTVELGSWMHIDRGVVGACAAGMRNVLRHAGMLDGDPEPIAGIPLIRPGYPVRRHMHPKAPASGIVQPLVSEGESIEAGQPVARLVDIFGEPVGMDGGLLRTEHSGFVIGMPHGVVRYAGDPVLGLAIRDDSDLIMPFPE
ncbi:MAG: succinylglutamate desuccinylase/aspartoacylase family protein [Anaerolineae bacterium]